MEKYKKLSDNIKFMCKGKCFGERSIYASTFMKLNSKCSVCQKAFNTTEIKCYCCHSRLRKRNALSKKDSLKAMQLMASKKRY